jgi:hypothetical protein
VLISRSPQPADRGRKGRVGVRVAVAVGQARPDQVALVPLHGRQVAWLAGIEQGEQLAGGGCIA